jgi:hypothetical protein
MDKKQYRTVIERHNGTIKKIKEGWRLVPGGSHPSSLMAGKESKAMPDKEE